MPTAKVRHRRTDFLEPMAERFFFGVAMDEENVAWVQLDRSPRALCEPTRLRPDEAQVSPDSCSTLRAREKITSHFASHLHAIFGRSSVAKSSN